MLTQTQKRSKTLVKVKSGARLPECSLYAFDDLDFNNGFRVLPLKVVDICY